MNEDFWLERWATNKIGFHEMDGPPFSIDQVDVKELYQDYYEIKFLQEIDASERLRGIEKASENAYYLAPV